MKTKAGIGLSNVQAVYAGPEGVLWELIMGQQIHIGGFKSSMDLAERAKIAKGSAGVDLCCCNGAGMRFLVRFRGVASMTGVDATPTVVEIGKRPTNMLLGSSPMLAEASEEFVRARRELHRPAHEARPGQPVRHARLRQGVRQPEPHPAQPAHDPQHAVDRKDRQPRGDRPDDEVDRVINPLLPALHGRRILPLPSGLGRGERRDE